MLGLSNSDADKLVESAKEGNQKAKEELYEEFWRPIYSFLMSRCKKQHLAEELVAETFIRAFRNLHQYKQGSFLAWLYTIARNLFSDYTKKMSTRMEFPEEPQKIIELNQHGGSLESEVLAKLEHEDLRTLLWLLPEKQSQVVELRFIKECSVTETARSLGMTEGAVKTCQFRAIAQLRSLLGQ